MTRSGQSLHEHFGFDELVELGFFIGLTLGQQRWIKTLELTTARFSAIRPLVWHHLVEKIYARNYLASYKPRPAGRYRKESLVDPRLRCI
jgi:hypothetical protein